jgi:hypothetical protein
MFVKMWDPPTESPLTPDFISPTNPVPEVMTAAGLADPPSVPHTLELDLLNGDAIDTWDGAKRLAWYMIGDTNLATQPGGTYPGPTIRMPRGVIFHATTKGKGPPPHTIHWHGLEPTPMNDGVGHCSMEIGDYTYQLQPSFIGSYFYHCHRNTMQHFEFGLYGLFLVEPPDAYFATQWDPTIPIGHCRDGKRRTAANLTGFPQFPNFVGGDIRDPDPEANNPNLPASLKFLSNPHAMTVAYDVEALWVFDDRDSIWSDLADNARATFPVHGTVPGYNDNFFSNAGDPVLPGDFFAFNDYRADYWFVTGVPVPAHKGETAAIPPGIVVPAELNSGISGSQVSVEALTNQTILFRVLDAAYNNCVYTFPFPIVIIAWDGRALGVAPYGFNHAYEVPANTPIKVSVGRRFDALARFTSPGNHLVKCEFIDTRGSDTVGFENVTCTALIPVNISELAVTLSPNPTSPVTQGTAVNFTAVVSGAAAGDYEFEFHLWSGVSWSLQQGYSTNSVWTLPATTPAGLYTVQVNSRRVGSSAEQELTARVTNFQVSTAAAPAATGVTLTDTPTGSQINGNTVSFQATGQGSTAYEYEFWLWSGVSWALVQSYSSVDTWVMPSNTQIGLHTIQVNVRGAGRTVEKDAETRIANYRILASAATGVTLTATPANSQTAGNTVSFQAAGQGSTAYEYEFWLWSGVTWELVQVYSSTDTWIMPGTTPPGLYTIQVNVRSAGSSVEKDAQMRITNYQIN